MTEKELQKIFCANIRQLRMTHFLSQVELARKTGVSINFINDLELGKKWASPATMVKLADVFKIEVYELLKPPGVFPDDLGGILKKFANNIHAAVDESCITIIQDEETKIMK